MDTSAFSLDKKSSTINCSNSLVQMQRVIPNNKAILLSLKELNQLLHNIYCEFLQLNSTNQLSRQFFDRFRSLLLHVAEKSKCLYKTNKGIIKLLFYLFIIYIKHNPEDHLFIKRFIQDYVNEALPLCFIKEIFKNEGIDIGSYKDYFNNTDSQSINLNSRRSLNEKLKHYFSPEFIQQPTIPFHLQKAIISERTSVDNQSGYFVEYTPNEENKKYYTIKGNEMISPLIGVYYFEVYSLSELSDFSIGLIANSFDFSSNSIGYHSISGDVFINKKISTSSYGPVIAHKDFIGLCINFIDNICFFAVNGVKLNDIPLSSLSPCFFAIAMNDWNQRLKINYGQWPFCYNLTAYKQSMMKKYYHQIIDSVISDNKKDYASLIIDYLAYNGYSDTLSELISLNDGNGLIYLTQANIRKKINELIIKNDFNSLKSLIEKNFAKGKTALVIVDFYSKICYGFNQYISSDNSFNEIVSLIMYLKENIISNKDYTLIKQIIPWSEQFIQSIIQLITEPIDKANSQLKNIIAKYSNREKVFETINHHLGDNESFQNKECQLETILKQLILILSIGIEHNQLLFKFIYSNDKDFDYLKELLKGKMKAQLQYDYSLIENLDDYFNKLMIEDKEDAGVNADAN